MQQRLKIVVGTNSLSEAQYPAYNNHCQFWFKLGRLYPHIDFIQVNPSRMSIDAMRNMSGQVAITNKADYLLFLDDDVLIKEPGQALQKLIDCNSDIAAGNVIIRSYPFNYMFFATKNKSLVNVTKLPASNLGKKSYTAVGFSLCLIKTALLEKLKAPWFITPPTTTEDVYFCLKAKSEYPKCKIVVDTSIECGHILWPEIVDHSNRIAYKKYMEATGVVIHKEGPLVKSNKQAKMIAEQLKGMHVEIRNTK